MAGGASSTKNFLDSTERLVEGDTAWNKVVSLNLPTVLRGPFMINVQNSVFLTGKTNKLLINRQTILHFQEGTRNCMDLIMWILY